MEDQKIKHLELIQSIVNRISNNSNMLKGWSVTLVSALFALATKDANEKIVLVAIFPLLVFWLLDGYYLFQERRFRALYDEVSAQNSTIPFFSMDTSHLNNCRLTYSCSLISKTIFPFYLVIFFSIFVLKILLTR